MRQFAVIGLGRFGSNVARALAEKGCQVLAIDIDDEKVQEFSSIAAQAVCVDASDEKALRAVGIADVDVAVVSIGDNIEASILITLALREIGIKQIVVKAVREDQGKVLEKIGANKIIFPDRDMGIRLANSLVYLNMSEHFDLSKECSIIEIKPPKEFIGNSLKKLNLRMKLGLNIVAIKSAGKDGEEIVNPIPEADYEIRPQDRLIIVGPNENIERLKRME